MSTPRRTSRLASATTRINLSQIIPIEPPPEDDIIHIENPQPDVNNRNNYNIVALKISEHFNLDFIQSLPKAMTKTITTLAHKHQNARIGALRSLIDSGEVDLSKISFDSVVRAASDDVNVLRFLSKRDVRIEIYVFRKDKKVPVSDDDFLKMIRTWNDNEYMNYLLNDQKIKNYLSKINAYIQDKTLDSIPQVSKIDSIKSLNGLMHNLEFAAGLDRSIESSKKKLQLLWKYYGLVYVEDNSSRFLQLTATKDNFMQIQQPISRKRKI